MRTALRNVLALAVGFGLSLAVVLPAQGCVYPCRPIRILIGNPAGSGPDAETRKFAELLSTELGQPVLVDNHPGAGGMIALQLAAKAAPDGYTLASGQIGNLAVNPAGNDLFDRDRDLAAVSLLGKHPWLLWVHSSLPAKTLSEFVALAKRKPGEITFACQLMSFTQLSGERFQRLTGTRLRIIPYGAKGWGTDLLAGHVESTFFPLIGMVHYAKEGKLRALAISGNERSAFLPEVPTFSEAGLPEFTDTYAWFGLVAPAGVPASVMERISAASIRAAQSPPFREFLSSNGAIAVGSTPAEFAAFLKSERAKWKRVAEEAGFKPE